MAKALLIKTPKRGKTINYVAVNLEPLGLLYIASFLQKFGPEHAVTVLDAQSQDPLTRPIDNSYLRMGMSDEAIRARIMIEKPDVIGISALFEVQESEIINVASIAKSVDPNIKVVVGGLDAGVRFANYLKSGVVDLVVRGDGEEPFLEIVNRIGRGDTLSGIDNTCEVLSSGETRQNKSASRAIPFDNYPLAARDMLERQRYDNPITQYAAFPFAKRRPALLMQGSRGCALRCAFCDIVAVQDTWNSHSPEYVVDEIQHCIERYGYREFIFVDDNFMLRREWCTRIFELIIQRNLKISLDILSGVSVWTLRPEVIDLMIEAGLYRVVLPIESGNPKTLKFIKKPVDLDKAIANIEHCNRRGLLTIANLIIGFPFETREDIDETIAFAKRSGLDAVNFYVAEPLTGARMYSIYKDNGWLEYENGQPKNWRTQHFTREELQEIAERATSEHMRRRVKFYMNPLNMPGYLWPKFSSAEKIRYSFGLATQAIFTGVRVTHDTTSGEGLGTRKLGSNILSMLPGIFQRGGRAPH
jgi:anaerobic magnesium-protoporphyrin IX monomethyl ester cyclase